MKKYSFLDTLEKLFAWTVILTLGGGGFVLWISLSIFPDMESLVYMIYLILCLSIGCYLIVNLKIAEFHEREKFERIMNGEEIAKIEKENDDNYSFLDTLGGILYWTLFLTNFCGGLFILGILSLIFPGIENFKCICMIYLILCLVIGCHMIVNEKIAELQKREDALNIMLARKKRNR